MVFGYALTRLS